MLKIVVDLLLFCFILLIDSSERSCVEEASRNEKYYRDVDVLLHRPPYRVMCFFFCFFSNISQKKKKKKKLVSWKKKNKKKKKKSALKIANPHFPFIRRNDFFLSQLFFLVYFSRFCVDRLSYYENTISTLPTPQDFINEMQMNYPPPSILFFMIQNICILRTKSNS